MKFFKAIQKTEAEPPEAESAGGIAVQNANEKQNGDYSESILNKRDLKIGAPSLPANGANKSAIDSINIAIESYDSIETSSAPMNLGAGLNGLREFTVESDRVNPHLVAITQPTSAFSEEYRNLRTQIIHSGQRKVLRSIVIASVGPGEGKSVTALNLSWLLAQTVGIRTLLIDGDLRMPSLANYLGFEAEKGLSQVLAGELPFKDSIIKLQPAGLFLLPGGEARNDVAELLSGPKLNEILAEARKLFDYVIIDAPPLGVFTDASVLINDADGAVLVVRADHTRYKDIERTLESLPREKMIGVVLNQSEDFLLGDSYYNYPYAKTY